MKEYKDEIIVESCSQVEGFNSFLKERILAVIENFHVNENQIPKLLGISTEMVKQVLQGNQEEIILTDEEISIILHRTIFLTEGYSLLEPQERIKTLIASPLKDEYGFTDKSLAAYAGVPYKVFDTFYYQNEEIEKEHLVKICLNLFMLSKLFED